MAKPCLDILKELRPSDRNIILNNIGRVENGLRPNSGYYVVLNELDDYKRSLIEAIIDNARRKRQ